MLPEVALELRRHHWAWLRPERLAAEVDLSEDDRNFLQDWVGSDRPLVVARQDLPGRWRLGVTFPVRGTRRRVGVTVAPEAILRSMPPLSLNEVCPHAPSAWQPTLVALRGLAREHGVDVRVYGSLALQYFVAASCLNPDSDLDLLIELEPLRDPAPVLKTLMDLQARHCVPRLDGEIRRGEWAVAWRELAALRGKGWVLAKSDRAVALRQEPQTGCRTFFHTVARSAVRGLYRELELAPKPGLVSFEDAGAHPDMSSGHFVRSLFRLRHYFRQVAQAGAEGATFSRLQHLGMAAEQDMMRVTGGVNTHRGAIFNLGLAAAAAGARPGVEASTLCAEVARRWGGAILRDAHEPGTDSHGRQMARQFGISGARGQAARGFPVLVAHGLPAYRAVLAATGQAPRAAMAAFFAMMAVLDDSNLIWRGGKPGLDFAQREARAWLAHTGQGHRVGEAEARALHRRFVSRRLSPGGSADLLALLLFLVDLEGHPSGLQVS